MILSTVYKKLYNLSQYLAHKFKAIDTIIKIVRPGRMLWYISVLTHTPTIFRIFKNWPTYIAACFGQINKEFMTIEMRDGLKIRVRPETNDIGTLFEVFVMDTYQTQNRSFKKTDIIVDIGSHIGSYSLLVSHKGDQPTIIAIEPQKDNYTLLCQNIKLNTFKRITPIHSAVLSTAKTATFYENSSNVAGHTFFPTELTQNLHGQTMQSTTLADIVSTHKISHINLMKVDCEGSEYDILFHCPQDILKIIDELVIEVHNLDDLRNTQTMIDFLRTHGFKHITCTQFPANVLTCRK